jgi:hypothetical protein
MIYSKSCGYFCDFECDLVYTIQFLPPTAPRRTMSDLKVPTYEDLKPHARAFKYGPTMCLLVRCRPISSAWSAWVQP